MRRLLGALVLAVGLAIVGTVVAVAAIPDAGGVIHGCYASKDGALRVVNAPSASCSTKETAISWSQAGQPGPQGPAGAQGAAGAPGAPGISGYEMNAATYNTPPAGYPGPGFITDFVSCSSPALRVLGGGYAFGNTANGYPNDKVFMSGPDRDSGVWNWHVVGQNLDTIPGTISIWVMCAAVS